MVNYISTLSQSRPTKIFIFLNFFRENTTYSIIEIIQAFLTSSEHEAMVVENSARQTF